MGQEQLNVYIYLFLNSFRTYTVLTYEMVYTKSITLTSNNLHLKKAGIPRYDTLLLQGMTHYLSQVRFKVSNDFVYQYYYLKYTGIILSQQYCLKLHQCRLQVMTGTGELWTT